MLISHAEKCIAVEKRHFCIKDTQCNQSGGNAASSRVPLCPGRLLHDIAYSTAVTEREHVRFQTHKKHPISLPHVRAMGCLMWVSFESVSRSWWRHQMETVTGPLCGEFTGHRWIPHIKASDAELWCYFWSAPEPTVEQTKETPVIWDAIALIVTSLKWG